MLGDDPDPIPEKPMTPEQIKAAVKALAEDEELGLTPIETQMKPQASDGLDDEAEEDDGLQEPTDEEAAPEGAAPEDDD